MNDCALLIALVIICCSLAAVLLIVTGNNPLHPVADELEIIIQHTLGIDEPTELKEMHIRILSEMEKTFADYSLVALPNGEPSVRLPTSDLRQLVEKINKYSLEMQKEVKKVLGNEAYIRLNGDEKFYLPINLEIALNLQLKPAWVPLMVIRPITGALPFFTDWFFV